MKLEGFACLQTLRLPFNIGVPFLPSIIHMPSSVVTRGNIGPFVHMLHTLADLPSASQMMYSCYLARGELRRTACLTHTGRYSPDSLRRPVILLIVGLQRAQLRTLSQKLVTRFRYSKLPHRTEQNQMRSITVILYQTRQEQDNKRFIDLR